MQVPALLQDLCPEPDQLLLICADLQTQLLNLLKPMATVVGDDMQSIYSFRGAYSGALLDFKRQYDHPDILQTLSTNYRQDLLMLGHPLHVCPALVHCLWETHGH